jgi:soluble lytic murein transglycosylase
MALLGASANGVAKPKDDTKSKAEKSAAHKPGKKPEKQAARKPGGKAVPVPRARPVQGASSGSGLAAAAARTFASAVPMPIGTAAAATSEADAPVAAQRALSYAPAAPATAADIDAVKDAIALARKGKTGAADERKAQIRDAAAQKLVEWAILRADDTSVTFARYAAFLTANPNWPSVGMLRRRAEGQLWQERRDPATVFAFLSRQGPLSTRGKLAAARALLAQGDRGEAQEYVRSAWRGDAMSAELESQVLETFGELLTRADHKARMDRRLYAQDAEGGMRAAKRLGGHEPAIAQLRLAAAQKAANTGALLEAVPNEGRNDAGYMLARAQWLRRADRIGEAAQVMLAAPRDPEVIHDTNEWWIERRLIARKLLDVGNPQAAYKVVRDAALPEKGNYRAEQPFTAGWIALRFLNDPITAAKHFADIGHDSRNPIALARAGYWQGRAAEAAGRNDEARRHYEAASRHPTAYYGQLARARLGRTDLAVRRPPELTETQKLSARQADVVRALDLLYTTGNRDLVIAFVAEYAERATDPAVLYMMAEIATRNDDARAMLFIGKGALAQGFAFDQYAFPGKGMPKYASIGPEIDTGVVYAIARQESHFNQRTVSTAKAMGLMQVTPAAGRYIAKKFGVTYHEAKLLQDPVYNTQMGAAEIGELVRDYGGNYALAFAAYNAGRGRVKEWIGRYGDPRNPDIDPIDWVERIPFAETRNYVQRVMENMQIYRARFGRGERLTIQADLRGKASGASQAAVETDAPAPTVPERD